MKKRYFLCLLVLSVFVFSLPFKALALDEESLLLCGDFENEEKAAELYLGGVTDPAAAYEGKTGMQVSNPYGGTGFNSTAHVLEYNSEFTLEAGEFYTFTAAVCNPMSELSGECVSKAYLTSRNILSVEVSEISAEWSIASVTFMAMETGEYTFALTLYGGDEYVGFFVDSMSLVKTERQLDYAVFEGPDSVFVPDTGYLEYRYATVIYDVDGLPVNTLIRSLDISSDSLPDGIEIDYDSGIMRVYSNAPSNAEFSIVCAADVGIPLHNGVKNISTTKNLISSPHFDDGEELWTSDGELYYEDGQLCLYADQKGTYGSYASIKYLKQLVLEEGRMYVFRASVKSEEDYPASPVYIVNSSFAASGLAEINITGIGGSEWSDAFSAFTVDRTGIYDLTINLFASSERPIYLDYVSLGVEDPAPSSISLHAPGNIQRAEEAVTLPCYAVLHDQMGRAIDTIPAELASPAKGVTVLDGSVTVEPDAECKDYLLTASAEGFYSELYLTVSDDAVGDGGFEEKEANEWWTASDGAFFSIFDIDENRYGYVNSPETSCIVINNSYMTLYEGRYYVYTADPSIGRGTVTAFISDAYTGEYIPLVQFDPLLDTKEPFIVDKTVTGRLVLHVQSADTVSLAMDNIAIVPAELAVSDVSVSADENAFVGSYLYINNMTTSPDADACSFKWYISSSEDGPFEEIPSASLSTLETEPYMDGKYVVFEVTPGCSVTALEGESVQSPPVLVKHIPSPDEQDENAITPVSLTEYDGTSFADCKNHWAEKYISSLFASGIIEGKGENLFDPEGAVTRAEFTAMILRSLSVKPSLTDSVFSDVPRDAWYAPYVSAASSLSIVEGMGEGIFAPNKNITREEMAVIICRALNKLNIYEKEDSSYSYYDDYLISSWAHESVYDLTAMDILTGENDLFSPGRKASRAEAAAVIYRMLKLCETH